MITPRLTSLLNQAQKGSLSALNEVYKLVYPELLRIAAALQSREKEFNETADLVNRAFEKVKVSKGDWESRKHFFGIYTRAITQILVELARNRNRKVIRNERLVDSSTLMHQKYLGKEQIIIELDDLMNQLEVADPKAASVCRARVFGGWSLTDIADYENVPRHQIQEHWRNAKAWLISYFESEEAIHHFLDTSIN